MASLSLLVRAERWPLARPFTIARGSKTEAHVVVATLSDGRHAGRGECVPYARYGESVEGVIAEIEVMRAAIEAGVSRTELLDALPPGAARNAIDCALWDYEAKAAGRSAAALAGLAGLRPVLSAFTISLDDPAAMAAAAQASSDYPLLKLKLGAEGDEARLAALRAARPDARLIVDANEGWTPERLAGLLRACAEAGVELVEQPLPADGDAPLAAIDRPVPVCADESVFTRAGLDELRDRYDAVNIKLDKAGGLTEALLLLEDARRLGFRVMVGSMVATSLAMAPALLLAQDADWADLDGPALLARDREGGLVHVGGRIGPPSPDLWG